MHILMLAPEPFFEARGTPISVYQRLQQLTRLGHQVTVLTYHIGQEVNLPGVRVRRIPNVWFVQRIKAGPSWVKPLLDALLATLAFAHLLQGNYQAVHSHEEAAIVGMLLAALFRKPHIYDMHSSLPRQLASSAFGRLWPLVKAFELLERWVLRTADGVIVVDEALQQIVERLEPSVRLVRLENLPIQSCGFSPAPNASSDIRARLRLDGRTCIVYSGTFEAYQGLDLLLASAKIVAQMDPNAAFVWVGGQPHQVRHWRDQVNASGLQKHVYLVGKVSLVESLAYLELADILVSPRREGTPIPLKIYTYLQAGKAIVATRAGGHTRVLTDQTALLVESTPDGLAAGLLRLTGDPVLREALGAQAKAYAQDKFALTGPDELGGLYRSLVWASDPAAVRSAAG